MKLNNDERIKLCTTVAHQIEKIVIYKDVEEMKELVGVQ
jgi:hypothetical protein